VNVSLLISALIFAWMHLIFRNPLAVILTLVGGWFFAQTYARTRSLRLVCLEHALYGNLIFTIGLGEYFCKI
jgi:membrane protease YdiL (CAAX protease family)